MFLTFLVTKTSSGQFITWPFAKMLLYFDILTKSSSSDFESSSIISLLELMYMFDFKPTFFILVVL